MKIPKTKIAVTLYNLRDYCKNKEDLDNSLAKVKQMGYEAVQVSGIGPIAAEDVREILDKHGLYCMATHENTLDLTSNIPGIIKKLNTLGCTFTALGFPGDVWTLDGINKLIPVLENAGKELAKAGILFGYHNHFQEFEKLTDKIILQEIMDRTNPKTMTSELDVYWAQFGGGNPARWIEKLKNRIHVIHLKDFVIINGKQQMCEILKGNMDYPSIIKACQRSNVRWYVVEQDQTVPSRDIFDSIKISYDNLRKLGVK